MGVEDQQILLLLAEGRSIRKTSRLTGVSRERITRLSKQEWFVEQMNEARQRRWEETLRYADHKDAVVLQRLYKLTNHPNPMVAMGACQSWVKFMQWKSERQLEERLAKLEGMLQSLQQRNV